MQPKAVGPWGPMAMKRWYRAGFGAPASLRPMETPDAQVRILLEGAEQVLPREEFERKVTAAARGQRPPLRAKFGVDPTAPDIHLGHTVPLRKLRDFQMLGHTAVLIIGGFTAQVGDPSGRTATRPRLTSDDVARHAETYLAQVRKVLLDDNLEVVNNADWLAPMQMEDVLRLTSRMTVARMLERADFAARYSSQRPIALSEFLYPLLQGQDSVAVRSDVELGGTDQTFNLLVGRDLQNADGQDGQCILTMPLLEGTDGSAKMSKTAGNSIGVEDEPGDMFGRLMSVPDPLMVKYFRLVTTLPSDQVAAIEQGLASGELHPGDTKRRLAREIVTLYHAEQAAAAAEERFNTQFVSRGVPDDIPSFSLTEAQEWFLPTLLHASGLCASTSEARRQAAAGAVRLDGNPVRDPTATLPRDQLAGRVLQVGKRRFVRLVG